MAKVTKEGLALLQEEQTHKASIVEAMHTALLYYQSNSPWLLEKGDAHMFMYHMLSSEYLAFYGSLTVRQVRSLIAAKVALLGG